MKFAVRRLAVLFGELTVFAHVGSGGRLGKVTTMFYFRIDEARRLAVNSEEREMIIIHGVGEPIPAVRRHIATMLPITFSRGMPMLGCGAMNFIS